MRDDIDTLPLSDEAKRYARMTSKDLGSDWSKKVDMYVDMIVTQTNQPKHGFANKDAVGKVPHAMKESSFAAKVKATSAWYKASTKHKVMDVDLASEFAEIIDDVAQNGLIETIVNTLLDGYDADKPERIVAAAVKSRNGKTYTGKVHYDAVQAAAHDGQLYSVHFGDEDFGFLTSKGRWVDRTEAELIGMSNKQIKPTISSPTGVHSRDFNY